MSRIYQGGRGDAEMYAFDPLRTLAPNGYRRFDG